MFGFRCQECGKGTVRATVRTNFETKFQRVPFVVPDAVVGVCDACGAEHFDAKEYKRWQKLFEEGQSRTGGVLSPTEICEVRASLGMTMSDFAALIGGTRQSLHHWEKSERDVPQSRMADMMLRLVREGIRCGDVKVVEFLYQRARGAGIDITMPSYTTAPEDSGDSMHGEPLAAQADSDEFDKLYEAPRKRQTFSPCLPVIADAA